MIPTTIGISLVGNTLTVESTVGFASSGTAYIDMDALKHFTYTSITATQFLGVSLHSGATFTTQDYITQTIEDDYTLYDYNMLLPKMGDRVFKKNQSKEEYLYTESDLAYLSKAYLREFVKNHGKLQADVLFAPYLKLGQTVSVTDTFGKLTNDRYFIETITYKPNNVSATLARYPG